MWALREGSTFEETLRLVVDLGGDTDTVAAVAGGLAGAVYGVAGIPTRWASAVHGVVPGTAASAGSWPTGTGWRPDWTAGTMASDPVDHVKESP